MKKLFIYIPALTVLLLFNCKKEKSDSQLEENKIESHKKHWSYEGETSPEHWLEIEKNSDCGGQKQSPVNIIEATTTTSNENLLKFHYHAETKLNDVVNNGHSIQFDFKEGDSINYNNKIYKLKQIHFHEPAEHLINGIKYPIEIHLVHLSDDKQIAVLSILGQEGIESEIFEFLESFLPVKNGETKTINSSIDLTTLFPEDKTFYSYSGSLTTPPCTEGVNWVIFKNPIVLSLQEVKKLQELMPKNNFRNEQELNGRTIYLNKN